MHKPAQDSTRKDLFPKKIIIHAHKIMETLSSVGPYTFHTYVRWFSTVVLTKPQWFESPRGLG